ncbi:hypothetical protein C2G38_2038788 [Gigaspora rosea]|uniref:FAR1 domain-containing protein n=1 Tax=Gigaspora rosea TaxID=44941 RepID=A0A397V497_9GLOM|nr:hypothetical protein C2G38_2038788 [Gigaspora rosea]
MSGHILEEIAEFEENNEIKINSNDADKFDNESGVEFDSENESEIEEEDRFNKRVITVNEIDEMLGQDFITKKDILNTLQEIARQLGFAVTIKSSGHRHFHLQCKRGGQPRNTSNLTVDTRKRKRMSKRCGCQFLLKAMPNNFKWRVTEIVNEHNHSMAKDERIFHEHRQLTRDTRCAAVRMLKAGARPSMIYEAIRNEDGKPIATRKDIYNLGLRINSLEETASMGGLIISMEERGYLVRREHYKGKFFY